MSDIGLDSPRSSTLPHLPQGISVIEPECTEDVVELTDIEPWDILEMSLEKLAANPHTPSPLKDVVTGLLKCLSHFYVASDELEHDKGLPLGLATRIVALDTYVQTPRLGITVDLSGCAKNHVSEIHRQISWVNYYSEGSGPDPRDAFRCYTIISEIVKKLEAEIRRINDRSRVGDLQHALAPANDAIYNMSTLRGWRFGCASDTRIEVLAVIRNWIHDPSAPSAYWVYGRQGVGKTAIVYTICEELDRDNRLAACFFGSELLPDCRDLRRVIPTIAYQLARFSYSFGSSLRRILQENPGFKGYDLKMQFEKLLRNPLRESARSLPSGLVVVLDALDSCKEIGGVHALLQEFIHAPELPIKFLVTSSFEFGAAMAELARPEGVRFHHLDQSIPSVQRDIAAFLKSGLDGLWLTDDNIQLLIALTAGSFVYATTCVRYLRSTLHDIPYKVTPSSLLQVLTSPQSENQSPLDGLYALILSSAPKGPQAQKTLIVLQAILCTNAPVPMDALVKLLELSSKSQVALLLKSFSSVIHVPEDGDMISIFHPSFRNFMLSYSQRFGTFGQGVDGSEQCSALALRCISIMQHTLRFNIYQMEFSYSMDGERPDDSGPSQDVVPSEVLYACCCWGACVEGADSSITLLSEIHEFLSCHLLHWMEVLNQSDCINAGVLCMSQVERWLSAMFSVPVEVLGLAQDAHSFVTSFSDWSTLLSTASIYITALPTWPATNPVSKYYRRKIRSSFQSLGLLTGQKDPALLSTWFTGSVVRSMSISLDGTRVLSNSTSSVARAWDLDNGDNVGLVDQLRPDFWGRPSLTSLAFSLDGSQIVLGSDDHSITVWDVRDPSATNIITGEHNGPINSVVFSPDGTLVASGSVDCAVRVWTLEKFTSTLQLTTSFQHTRSVLSVAFSHDCSLVASGSEDHTIYVMDARRSSIGTRLIGGHIGPVNSVAFAPNSNLIVSGSSDHTICLWHMTNQRLILYSPYGPPIEGHTDSVNSVMFSPNGKHIVSGSSDLTIRIWEVQSGEMVLGPFRGHTKRINSVSFTPDGSRILSGSDDGTIRIWSTEQQELYLQLEPATMEQANLVAEVNGLRSREMSALQMFKRLIEHGCLDLTLTVNPERFSSCMLIGGSFGDIWKGRLNNGTDVAIKVWRFTSITEDGGKSLKRAMRELYHWSKMSHNNIHKLLGVIMFQGRLGMVSRWMDHGHLREYIRKDKAVDRYQLCLQVAKGVKYLHDKNMVHGDLKACNILVSADGVAKITDFDHSIISDCSLLFSATTQMGGGTLRWMAPELVLETTHQRGKRSDIYALGMTFLVRLPKFSDVKSADGRQEIVTGCVPYFPECRNDPQVLNKLSQKKFPEKTKDFTQDNRGENMWALLVQCWDHKPSARPTAHQVLDELQHLTEEMAPLTVNA